MEILKTIVITEEDGQHYLMDTIQEDEKLWLVPQWVEQGVLPQRMVCIDEFRPRRLPAPKQGVQRAHYEIADHPLPRALLDGSSLSEELSFVYEVREGEAV